MQEPVIEGVVLSAGFGARMLPLSREVPKPLFPVTGVAPLEIAAARLARAGASRIHVNLHHLGEKIRRFAQQRELDFAFHPERELLGTGGGIGAMAEALPADGTILLHNADVVSSIGFEQALGGHTRSGALVTLILLRPGEALRAPPAAVTLTGDGAVTGIDSTPRPARPGERRLGYTGLAILDAKALDFFPRPDARDLPAKKRDLVSVLLEMIDKHPGSVVGWEAGDRAAGLDAGAAADSAAFGSPAGLEAGAAGDQAAGRVAGTAGDPAAWGEIGTPAAYLDIHRRILVEKTLFDPLIPPPPLTLRADPGARIDPGARWSGFLDVGRGCVIEHGSLLEDCVIMDGARIESGTVLRTAVVYRGGTLEVG